MVTVIRILYIARGVKIAGKRAFALSFYTEPTGLASYQLLSLVQPKTTRSQPRQGQYQSKIYICELTKGVKRWAVMQTPCRSDLGMNYGYVGYVSLTAEDGRKTYLTNNRPAVTKFSSQ